MRCKGRILSGDQCSEKARLFGYCIRHLTQANKKSPNKEDKMEKKYNNRRCKGLLTRTGQRCKLGGNFAGLCVRHYMIAREQGLEEEKEEELNTMELIA